MSSNTDNCDSCSDAQLIRRLIDNPPSQSSLKYRVGTFAQFRQSMFVDLSQSLANLRTRSNDDLAIGLVDGWATLSDIITFYQERIANETYLRTATEKKSILELARTVGYELRPGVAATTYLAFTIDKTVDKTIIDAGTKIQSMPAQNQKPVVFETVDKIEARPDWNNLKVKTCIYSPTLAIESILDPNNGNTVTFKKINLKLKVGDGLLVSSPTTVCFLTVTNIEEDTVSQTTTVNFTNEYSWKPLSWKLAGNTIGQNGSPWTFGQTGDLVGEGAVFLTGNFTDTGSTQVLFYYPYDGHWWLGTFDNNGKLTWNLASSTSDPNGVNFGNLVTAGSCFWVGQFAGAGKTSVLFYHPSDRHWWLGTFTGNTLNWNLADDSSGFGNTANDPTWIGDFTGSGSDSVLFHHATDGHWWLGVFNGNQINWNLASSTSDPNGVNFGNLVTAGSCFWVGQFAGAGKTSVLFYHPSDRHWWLGTFTGNTLNWNLADDSSGFGNTANDPTWIGDFTGSGSDSVLFHHATDGHWWLGVFNGNQINWNLVGNTIGQNGSPWPPSPTTGNIFWATGNFTDTGSTQVLFHYPDDGNWWLGTFDNNGKLTWNQCENTVGFGSLPEVFFKLDFKGVDKTDLLVYDPNNGNWWRSTFHCDYDISIFRTKCNIFGFNSPMLGYDTNIVTDPTDAMTDTQTYNSISSGQKSGTLPSGEITPTYSPTGSTIIFLDNNYPSIKNNTLIALKGINHTPKIQLYLVSNIDEQFLALFNITGKSTSLTLDTTNLNLQSYTMRKVIVFAQPEKLTDKLAEVQIDSSAAPGKIILDQKVDNLTKGQYVAISDASNSGPPQIAMINDMAAVFFDEHGIPQPVENAGSTQKTFTQISLNWITPSSSPQYEDWSTVSVNANVAKATHGETKQEILGSGIQIQQMQEFTLKQSPLTYVSDSTPSGSKSTLEVKVNGIIWNEVQSLYGLGSKNNDYIIRMDESGQAHVIFGDGIHGRLLPNGQNNVTATYRVGTGIVGMVNANQISLPMSRPLGLKRVANPLPSIGAQDPEQMDDARQNATLTLQTLDRIVSLDDFENYAIAFSGIGKAQANWLWSGQKQVVHATIAPATEINSNDPSLITLLNTFKDSVNKYKDPLISVHCDIFTPKLFSIDASLLVASDRNFDAVKVEVENSLYNNFSYSAMELGKSLSVSEILSKIQEVDGVVAAYINSITVDSTELDAPEINTAYIPCNPARYYQGTLTPAELLILEKGNVTLSKLSGDGFN